jgi:hypothetical protein
MMNEKTRTFKIYVSFVLTLSLILGFFAFPVKEVKAEDARYVTQIITDYNDFDLNSTEYVCTTYKYKLGDRVDSLPADAAIVTVKEKGADAEATHNHGAQISVHAVQKGSDFDSCSEGAMRYIENETYELKGTTNVTGTGWIYACNAYWRSQHILTQPMYIYVLSNTQPDVHTWNEPDVTPGTATFTATCNCENCTNPGTISLTLVAENEEFTGSAYSSAFNKYDKDNWTFAGLNEPTLTYYISDDFTAENKTSSASGGAISSGAAPTAVGTYYVVAEAVNNENVAVASASAVFMITPTRATQSIAVPTFSAIGSDTVILEAIEPGYGETLYGINTSNSAPKNWQNSLVFTGLTPETEYFFFAKYTGDYSYRPAVSTGNPATTLEASAAPIEIPAELYAPTSDPETTTENYTIPVTSENSVPVTANIEEGVAAIEDITEETMDNILGKNNTSNDTEKAKESKKSADTIHIDLSGAEQSVSGVKIPTPTIEKFEQITKDNTNDINTVTVKFSDAEVVIDNQTLNTIKDATKDDGYVKLVVEDRNEEKLLAEQKEAVKTHSIERVFEAYFETEKGTRIHDFKGGKAMVYLDFKVPKGKEAIYFHVYYVSEQGELEKYYTTVGSGKIGFSTTHFSDYVIIYDENDANGNMDILGYDENGKAVMKDDLESISTGRTFGRLKARATDSTEDSMKIEWTYVPEADGYILYGNFCNHEGEEYKYQYIKTFNNNKVLSYESKDLCAGTYYKYVVRAYKVIDGERYIIAQSVAIHEVTEGDKYTNATAVLINKIGKTKYETIGKVKYFQLAGKVVKIDAEELSDGERRQHRGLCYESSDTSIATVDKDGYITMVSKGTCDIWVYAQNGCYSTIKLLVK